MEFVDRSNPTTAPRKASESRRAAHQRETGARRWPNPQMALDLWSRLIRLRSTGQPSYVAETEEMLFWFYVPLAHKLADDSDSSDDADQARRRAELGLAKAIRIWPLPDAARFEEYARNAIRAEFLNGSQRSIPVNPILVPRHGRRRTGPAALRW